MTFFQCKITCSLKILQTDLWVPCLLQFHRSTTSLISTPKLFYCLRQVHQHQTARDTDQGIPRIWGFYHQPYLDSLQRLSKYVKTTEEQKIYVSDESVKMLSDTFNVTSKKLQNIVKQKEFQFCSNSHLTTMAKFLKAKNVTKEHIIRAPWLLWQKEEELEEKFSLLKQSHLFENIIDGLGFTLFDSKLIEKYNSYFEDESEDYPHHRNKIYYIGEKLNLSIDLLSIKLIYAWRVLHQRKLKLDAVIKVLLDYKIKPLDIVNDAWIFLNNVELMKKRLEKMREVSNDPQKLWICRCSESRFERSYCWKKVMEVGDKNLYDILHTELGLDKQHYDVIPKKLLLSLSLTRTRYKIFVLKKAGIDTEVLRNNVRMLMFSPHRIIERMEKLKGVNYHVSLLITSEIKFERYLKRLKRRQSLRHANSV